MVTCGVESISVWESVNLTKYASDTSALQYSVFHNIVIFSK